MKRFLFTALTVLLLSASASAQFDFGRNDPTGGRYIGGPRLGESQTQTWRAGIVIEPGTAMSSMLLSIPVPMEWREQKIVSVNEERMDANLASQIEYRNIGGVMEMRIPLRNVRPAKPLELVVAFEVQNYELLPPENTEQYVIPSRVPLDVQPSLRPSPTIESSDPIFARMFTEITKDRKTDWDKVEALYSFVQNNVTYDNWGWKNDAKGALALVRMPKGTWTADCKDMSCLFVALCRAGKIPARIVRVPEHCYAEFYLEMKPEGRARNDRPVGFWFPCQVSGTYSFGGIPEKRVILQKGDSFPDPGNPKAKMLFLKEYFGVTQLAGTPEANFRWVHDVVVK